VIVNCGADAVLAKKDLFPLYRDSHQCCEQAGKSVRKLRGANLGGGLKDFENGRGVIDRLP